MDKSLQDLLWGHGLLDREPTEKAFYFGFCSRETQEWDFIKLRSLFDNVKKGIFPSYEWKNEYKRRVVYRERNRILRAMGYSSYEEYLKSDLWKNIRKYHLLENPLCVSCDGIPTQVHHSAYTKKVLREGNTFTLSV